MKRKVIITLEAEDNTDKLGAHIEFEPGSQDEDPPNVAHQAALMFLEMIAKK